MPYQSNDDLPKGVKGLPPAQQTKWRKIFNSAYNGTCKDKSEEERDKCAASIAWSQIDDKYKGKSALVLFSMAIRSATHNKQENTLRWKAVASDTDEDFYHDNMSLELFDDFIKRIEIKEIAPEEFRSSFWQGGMPYISVSHYPDLEGKAAPGITEKLFVDGKQFRAYGQFFKSQIGLACYHAICKDLYSGEKPENPIRVSIAFLDYGHTHKASGFQFERNKVTDICPECVLEEIRGEFHGKIFTKGLLVHLALTRVPANERTSMEVERSMTTRKEDAASIIGDELAEELDEKAKLVDKSQAFVIKVEVNKAEQLEPSDEPLIDEKEEQPEVLVEEARKEYKEDDEEEGCSDEEKPSGKKKKEMKSAVDERLERIEKMLSDMSVLKPVVETVPEHELDNVFSNFKSAYDEIKALPTTPDDKLRQLQEYFNEVGQEVIARMQAVQALEPEASPEPVSSHEFVEAISKALIGAIKPVSDKLDLLITQQTAMVKTVEHKAIPERRSIAPTLSMQKDLYKPQNLTSSKENPTPKLRALIQQRMG